MMVMKPEGVNSGLGKTIADALKLNIT